MGFWLGLEFLVRVLARVRVLVHGKVKFGLKYFSITRLWKKFMPVYSHNDPNLIMHWHREMENVAGIVLFRVRVLVRVRILVRVRVLVKVRVLIRALSKLGFC